MQILVETPISFQIVEKSEDAFKPVGVYNFKDHADTHNFYSALSQNKIPPPLKNLLTTHLIKKPLFVCEKSLKALIESTLSIECEFDVELARSIRENIYKIVNVARNEFDDQIKSYSHFVGNLVLKDTPDRMDVMVVESLGLLDELEKDINIKVMRLKEWYGFHFPELIEIIPGSLEYASAVRVIGRKINVESLSEKELKDIEKIKEKARMSFGTEIDNEEAERIKATAVDIIKMFNYKDELSNYLKNAVNKLCPNLTALLGEVIAARFIARAGGIYELSKLPASTIQIMGAEKSLFNAIREKTDTPKYGYIYHSTIVASTPVKFRGKIARSLAAKAAIACKIDAFGKGNAEMGVAERKKLEQRIKVYEDKINKKDNKKESRNIKRRL